jgi:hemerythrin superfamily protein
MEKEESIFYPACEKISELKPLVAESYEDHKFVKALLEELSEISQNTDRATSKMKTLIEEVEAHVMEEENDLFPRVRVLMKKGKFNKLSRDIRLTRKKSRVGTKKKAA